MAPFLWGPILDIGSKLIDKLFPDPEQKAKAQLELLKLQDTKDARELEASLSMSLAQLKVNEEEAKSTNIFVSGWRPAVGWVCVGGLFYQFLFRPLISWFAANYWMWSDMPSLENETLMTLLFGMLGLGAFRTVEKVKGKD